MINYEQAGVSINKALAFTDTIRTRAQKTSRAGVPVQLSGFHAVLDPKKITTYQDPLIILTTDGVGTKLKIAEITGIHHTIGIDLVAMCVNDLVVSGAEPLAFLDYYASGQLNLDISGAFLEGLIEGCQKARCALIGGETAEMPDMYDKNAYDVVGFAIGFVERERYLPRKNIIPSDVILGLASSGLHANGFSLVRRIIQQQALNYHHSAPFDMQTSLGEALLTPTRIYTPALLEVLPCNKIKALAHITGGGLIEKLPQVIPSNLAVILDREKWPIPPVFTWIAHTAGVSCNDMLRTFNCGVGMAVIVAEEDVAETIQALHHQGETVFTIGHLQTWEPHLARFRLEAVSF